MEEAAIQQEATILSLKKKHQDAIAEMSEQIDQLNKLKTKAETEKALWSKFEKRYHSEIQLFQSAKQINIPQSKNDRYYFHDT